MSYPLDSADNTGGYFGVYLLDVSQVAESPLVSSAKILSKYS